jgi:hypothetical protein
MQQRQLQEAQQRASPYQHREGDELPAKQQQTQHNVVSEGLPFGCLRPINRRPPASAKCGFSIAIARTYAAGVMVRLASSRAINAEIMRYVRASQAPTRWALLVHC